MSAQPASSVNMNVDALLNKSFQEVADAPEFVIPLNGAYKVLVKSVERKVINNKPAIVFVYQVQQVLQLAEQPTESEPAPKVGDIFSESFYFAASQESLSYLKKHVKEIGKNSPAMSIGELCQSCEGQVVGVVTKKRAYTDKSGNPAMGFNTMGLLPA